jgi:hypothetical protein
MMVYDAQNYWAEFCPCPEFETLENIIFQKMDVSFLRQEEGDTYFMGSLRRS